MALAVGSHGSSAVPRVAVALQQGHVFAITLRPNMVGKIVLLETWARLLNLRNAIVYLVKVRI